MNSSILVIFTNFGNYYNHSPPIVLKLLLILKRCCILFHITAYWVMILRYCIYIMKVNMHEFEVRLVHLWEPEKRDTVWCDFSLLIHITAQRLIRLSILIVYFSLMNFWGTSIKLAFTHMDQKIWVIHMIWTNTIW